MKYDWIDNLRAVHGVQLLCAVLQVSRSGYYKHLHREASARNRSAAALLAAIRVIAATHKYRYGSPRMTAELRRQGLRCSENRVATLMARHRLGVRRKKRVRTTTQQDRKAIASPNLLAQCFVVHETNRVYLTDTTYIATDEGWLFLTAVLDLASRRIVGWAMLPTLEQSGMIQAMRQALGRRKPTRDLIVHSDRGSQYTSRAFRALLKEHGITQSMSGTGNCYDNAPMESFFGTLKEELVSREHYTTRRQAEQSIADYLELYYNALRLHSALNYLTPIEWEQQKKLEQTNTTTGR
jgi:putative transposase